MITVEQLQAIMPHATSSNVRIYLPDLNAAMEEFGIDTDQRRACFLAQLAHESGSLRYTSELASGDAYNHRTDLGNTKPEAILAAADHGSTPGRWWKGHGLIQITGYDNHVACGQALGLDLVHNPTQLTYPKHAARSAAWFWKVHGLNKWADANDFDGVSDMINRGHKTEQQGDALGYQDRLEAFNRAKEILGIA